MKKNSERKGKKNFDSCQLKTSMYRHIGHFFLHSSWEKKKEKKTQNQYRIVGRRLRLIKTLASSSSSS